MRLTVTTLVRIALAMSAIYLAMMGVSYLVYPPSVSILDTYEKSYVYGRDAGLVVRGREVFHGPGTQVFIVGASNDQEGFRPEIVMQHVPGVRVHNLAVGASNITQAKQSTELVLEALDKEQKRNAIFVLGIIYPHFVENKVRWKGGNTTLEDEMLRFGLYRRVDGAIKPSGSEHDLERMVFFLRPYLAVDSIVYHFVLSPVVDLAVYVYNRWGRKTSILNARDLDAVRVDEGYKKYRLKFWNDYMGTRDGAIGDEQFLELQRLAGMVKEAGATLFIVDLPIPQWHMDRAPHFAAYQKKKEQYLNQLKRMPGVVYLDMQDRCDDFDFYDSVHPKPRTRIAWSHFLGEKIRQYQEKKTTGNLLKVH